MDIFYDSKNILFGVFRRSIVLRSCYPNSGRSRRSSLNWSKWRFSRDGSIPGLSIKLPVKLFSLALVLYCSVLYSTVLYCNVFCDSSGHCACVICVLTLFRLNETWKIIINLWVRRDNTNIWNFFAAGGSKSPEQIKTSSQNIWIYFHAYGSS